MKEINVEIDFYKQKELDLGVKEKRRQIREDYDYDDDFLERFEGDDQLIDLDCNIENFFIYKGDLEDKPKKIARKYKLQEEKDFKNEFEFENKMKPVTKRDQRFHNLFYYILYCDLLKQGEFSEKIKIRKYIEKLILRNRKILIVPNYTKKEQETELSKQFLNTVETTETDSTIEDEFQKELDKIKVKSYTEEEIKSYLEGLKSEINEKYTEIKSILSNVENYKNNFKSFDFKNENFIELSLEFITDYVIFYYADQNDKIKIRAINAIIKMFAEECTNNRLKKHIVDLIEEAVKKNNLDLKEVLKGNYFVKAVVEQPENKLD